MEDKADSQFKVSDRRRFSPEGEPLDQTDESQNGGAEPSEQPEQGVDGTGDAGLDAAAQRSREAPPLPEASFDLLVVSLGMQAQMELGQEWDTNALPPNLDLARHTIDLLAVLRAKTKGNLTMEESRLLENTLTELRFRYVDRVKQINQGSKS